ncbi:MAG: HPF/RaiA family ribosome-associated protein [Chloroflexota bacterium]|nr:HPF/RaiA family ribosome-associated protein [Chloroflexota bacterium]
MQIQVNTDSNIDGSEQVAADVRTVIENALSRSSDQITRVEVHLSDENSDKKGGNNDIRCLIEARLEGQPVCEVTDQAATLEKAVAGASGKLARMIESTLGRQRAQEGRQI